MSQQHIFYCYYFTFNLALQKWILKFNYHTRNTTCRTLRQIGTTGGRSVCFRGAQMPACAGPSDWPDTWIITITGPSRQVFSRHGPRALRSLRHGLCIASDRALIGLLAGKTRDARDVQHLEVAPGDAEMFFQSTAEPLECPEVASRAIGNGPARIIARRCSNCSPDNPDCLPCSSRASLQNRASAMQYAKSTLLGSQWCPNGPGHIGGILPPGKRRPVRTPCLAASSSFTAMA